MRADEKVLLDAIATIHAKRAWYLLGKWADRGWYEYGVTLDLGWLTDDAPTRPVNR